MTTKTTPKPATEKHGPGRPKAGIKRKQYQIKLTPGERAAWKAEAEREGRDMPNWVRWVCNARAGFDPKEEVGSD